MALVRTQLAALPKERLEFDLLFFEQGPWKTVCDLAHPSPSIWAMDDFQNVCFGQEPASGSLLADARSMSVSNLPALLNRHPSLAAAYSFIRSKLPPRTLDDVAKSALAKAMPLADVVWYFEELHTPVVAAIIDRRLAAGEAISGKLASDNFGKLLERLLTFRRMPGVTFWQRLMPHAERQLGELQAQSRLALAERVPPLQQLAARAAVKAGGSIHLPEAVAQSVMVSAGLRVAVLGDASSSMQVAINAACICACMCAACFDAELVFFNKHAFSAKSVEGGMPRTVEDVLRVCSEVRANGTTSPAAALDHFYTRGTEIDLFVLVSDEGENTPSRQGLTFAQLFARYVSEVNPFARCAFVSFLDAADEGHMLKDMKTVVDKGGEAMAGKLPRQHRFDPFRPDLSKFDALMATLLQDAQAANMPLEIRPESPVFVEGP